MAELITSGLLNDLLIYNKNVSGTKIKIGLYKLIGHEAQEAAE